MARDALGSFFVAAWWLGLWGAAAGEVRSGSPALRSEAIYERATVEFKEAYLFKPAEDRPNDLACLMAPWVLQEARTDSVKPIASTGAAQERSTAERHEDASVFHAPSSKLHAPPDSFGRWSEDAKVDVTRPTVYVLADTAWIGGNTLARFTYFWRYPEKAGDSAANTNLAMQGVRITLNPAGQPAIWEALADRSGAELIFVSRSLESAALKEFGKPLPGRHHAVERSAEEAPIVTVARVIEDGPAPMGPMIYLSADSHSISTVICRCMPAQAKRLLETRSYRLEPTQLQALDSIKSPLKEHTAFWPGQKSGTERVERCLRLPSKW
jgi:hypothetical protein